MQPGFNLDATQGLFGGAEAGLKLGWVNHHGLQTVESFSVGTKKVYFLLQVKWRQITWVNAILQLTPLPCLIFGLYYFYITTDKLSKNMSNDHHILSTAESYIHISQSVLFFVIVFYFVLQILCSVNFFFSLFTFFSFLSACSLEEFWLWSSQKRRKGLLWLNFLTRRLLWVSSSATSLNVQLANIGHFIVCLQITCFCK